MKKLIKILCASVLLFSMQNVYSQQVESIGAKVGENSDYSRNSLTVLYLDNGVNFHSNIAKAMNTVVIPDKFDNNMLDNRVLTGAADLKSIMSNKHIANEILAKWFSRKADGSFDMSVVHERGLYNATDADVIAASASKLGLSKLQDAGENLVAHSYILVLSYKNVKTMEQVYNEQDANKRKYNKDAKPVSRPKVGYQGELVGYLYKLSDVKNTMNNFYSTMWIFDDEQPDVKESKKQAFDNANFELEFVSSASATVEGAEYKSSATSAENQFSLLVNNSISSLINSFEAKVADLKVRTALYSKHPLKAKIGTKESLSVDDRYFVYEYRMNNKNEVYAERRGVIRAKKVADNRKVASGNTSDDASMSKFYQVAGHSLAEGMFLEQSNDLGVGVILGYGAGAMSGANLKIEALTGSITNVPQLKMFIAGHIDFGKYDLRNTCSLFRNDSDLEDAKMIFYGAEFGFSKGFYLLHNFSLSAHLAFGAEWADFSDSDLSKQYLKKKTIATLVGGAGVQAAINLRYNLQLIGSLTYYAGLGDAFTTAKDEDEDDTDFDINAKYSDLFDGRADAANISFGVRIEF